MQKKVLNVSAEGLRKMQEELERLKAVERAKAAKELQEARAFGDLSENSEYDAAKNHQAKIEQQISELEEQIKNAVVVDDTGSTDVVRVGLKVKVHDYELGEEVEYSIVGITESDPLSYKISDESPIGKALIGRKVGDVFDVETPGGAVKLKVKKISK